MQTFLPYENFRSSLKALDYKRLGKQRVESYQILLALNCPPAIRIKCERNGLDYSTYIHKPRWINHPAVKMWKNYELALIYYYNDSIQEWVDRGYNNTMPKIKVLEWASMPWWLGDDKFHASHRSNLLRKDPSFYSQYGWDDPTNKNYVPSNLDYVWPVK